VSAISGTSPKTHNVSEDFYKTSILPMAGIIIKICRAYSNSREEFDDYYQEVCLQLWRSKDMFREQCKWSTWVYRVALNVCLTLVKKQKKSRQTFYGSDVPDIIPTGNTAFEDESLEILYAAIRHLSAVDRALIILYLEEKSYQEIAEILGTNTNNIAVKVNRIKERLKNIINEKFY
jgi:RNA polymerase sigma-70 factor, ECF subfamily